MNPLNFLFSRPILFTDVNVSHALIADELPFLGPAFLPTWDTIFDYYDTDPIANGVKSFVAVDPKKGVRSSTTLAKGLQGPGNPLGSRSPHKIEKRQRQGEFDNMHIAPPMAMSKKLFLPPSFKTDDISMAPICVHDCLHMHWRWGILATEKAQKGFDASDTPHSEIGAPMVPRNQKVTIHLVPPAGFVYEAEATEHVGSNGDTFPIRAGTWTVFMHHGMAYANGIWDDSTFDKMRDGVELYAGACGEPVGQTSATGSVALFYWRLRYARSKDTLFERLRFLDLEACRKL